MSMFELTSLLWHRKLQAGLVAAVLFVVGAAGALSQRKVTYTARSQVVFDQPALVGNISGINVPGKMAQLIPTFCRLLSGDAAAAEIGRRVGVDPGTARSATLCSALPGTTVVVVSARSGSADLARRVSIAAAETLTKSIRDRYNSGPIPPREKVDASVLVAATRPHRDPDRTKRQLLLVLIGSLVLGGAFVVAAEPHRRLSIAEVRSDLRADHEPAGA